MATKKKSKKSAPKASSLRFRIEWIFDPGPEFFRLDRAAQSKVNALKSSFTKSVNEVINKAQH